MLRIAAALFVLAALTLAHADPADAKPNKFKKCYAWGADGKKIATSCQNEADQAAEAEAYKRMKANQKPEPTTEHCQMVKGELVCQPAP